MGVDLCIPPIEHEWVDWFQDTGMMHRYCKKCDAEHWKPIDNGPTEQCLEFGHHGDEWCVSCGLVKRKL
jgi:hypothetical protein